MTFINEFLFDEKYREEDVGHSDAENEQLGRKLGFDLGMSC